MPAFYTHYIFGKLGYQDMEEGALKEMVRRYKKVYAHLVQRCMRKNAGRFCAVC